MKALVTVGGKTAAVKTIDTPKPQEGEILIKVAFIAQNPVDYKSTATAPPGRIVGCDFAGTVADTNGSHWREGQRVAGFVQGTTIDPTRGAFAEYVVVEAPLVYPIPERLSSQEAAALPLAFATAIQGLYQRLKIPEPSKPAKSAFPILISGGTSSVGQYAVQLAKLSGLYVVATGSKRNHELLRRLGADATIDYNDEDWVDQIKKVTHDGLEHAFDCIAELSTTQEVAKAMSSQKGGHVVCIISRNNSEIDPSLTKVKIESTIVFTVFQRPIKYGTFDNCGEETPEDKAHWAKWLSILPDYLAQGRILPNPVREFGGIDDILKGFEAHRQGKVSAEKLVYHIG